MTATPDTPALPPRLLDLFAAGYLEAAYAHQAKDSELIQYTTEIKVRAERRCGELLARTEKHGGGKPTENRSNDATGFAPTLSQMGRTLTRACEHHHAELYLGADGRAYYLSDWPAAQSTQEAAD
ncbi:hypothetical protein [Thiomonas intermedia]|uniref:hypothetical protein n=1 Tax=Thiomonas intermedia TaxID=926 RepID=UPI0009A4CB9E|nr:hypothetical protein [Thiomonas intermedia]